MVEWAVFIFCPQIIGQFNVGGRVVHSLPYFVVGRMKFASIEVNSGGAF